MLCAFFDCGGVSRSDKYQDSSKSNTLFLTIRLHVSFDGNIDVLNNSVRLFNSWHLHIIL